MGVEGGSSLHDLSVPASGRITRPNISPRMRHQTPKQNLPPCPLTAFDQRFVLLLTSMPTSSGVVLCKSADAGSVRLPVQVQLLEVHAQFSWLCSCYFLSCIGFQGDRGAVSKADPTRNVLSTGYRRLPSSVMFSSILALPWASCLRSSVTLYTSMRGVLIRRALISSVVAPCEVR